MDAFTAAKARSEDVEKLRDMIKDIRIAMLTTVDDDGTLRSRPMATQQTEFDGDLWFFTDKDAAKVHEVEQERDVNVSYIDPENDRYVSVSGKATLILDRDRIDALWHPALTAWFPEGKDDPRLALLRVQVEKAEYWESPSSTVVKLVGFVKALATGRRFQEEVGENEKLQM